VTENRPENRPGSRLDKWPAAGLILLGALLSRLNWLYLPDFWGDAGRWHLEVYRAATGEWPYRDFFWQFPPFSLWLFAGAFRLFGAKFWVSNGLLDLLSLGALLMFWIVARRVMSPMLAWWISVAFACGASAASGVLFTVAPYTPAVVVGALSGLTALYAGLNLIEGRAGAGSRIALALCSLVGILNKPEYLLATLVILALISVFRTQPNWKQRVLWITVLWIENLAPAILVYSWVASQTTWERLRQGLMAFDAATTVCGWWPTGYGAMLQLAALGRGMILVAVLGAAAAALSWKTVSKLRLVGVLAAGFALAVLQHWQIEPPFHDPVGRPLLFRLGYYFLRTNTILLPVVAALFIAAPVLLWWLWHNRDAQTRPIAEIALFTMVGLGMAYSCRGWFSETTQPGPTLSIASYPFLFLLLPLLAKRAAAFLFPDGSADRVLGALLALYAVSSLLGAFVFSRHHFAVPVLETRAGPIRPGGAQPVAEVYQFVESHLAPGDSFLELGYGGGITMAAALRDPLYNIQMTSLNPPRSVQEADVVRFRRNPPKLVLVAPTGPFYGTALGGIEGCAFPRLIWRPTYANLDMVHAYPIVSMLDQEYREVFHAGDIRILEHR
jgi:hypothetical protein